MKTFIVVVLTVGAILGLLFFSAVSTRSSANALAGERESVKYFAATPPPPPRLPAAPEPVAHAGKLERRKAASAPKGGGGFVGSANGVAAFGDSAAAPAAAREEAQATEDKGAGPSGTSIESPGATTRAWFPETFLFEPLIVTDAQGRANVPVRVPDRLTTWRVLALAHSRGGGQAGTVTSFLGTLPTYVEPVTPAFLYAGDEVKLPIQVVNTTDAEVVSPLQLSVRGATLAAVGGTVRVPAAGNIVQYATLTTKVPGNATLRAALGTTDAIEKVIPVQPAGLRVVQAKGGTLAAPRSFSLTGPADTLPGTEGLRLRVMPGALGVVRSELSAAVDRGGVAEDAYLLQLLGEAPALLASLGGTVDEKTVRDLSILATQRVMRHARAPSVDAATLLTEAALAHPQNPVLARLGERLAAQVAQSQRPDGTCQGATGWTLQRLLVTTGDCVRAVSASSTTPQARQRATAVTVKASGAFERNLARVNDGYTAAAILASGVAKGTVAEVLKKQITEHLVASDDGSKYLEVGQGVSRADGRAPSTYEATALAILALGNDPVVADLGSYLMSGYSASWGWGDGRANLVCLRAAVQLFKAPVPAGVKIVVARDGKPLAEGTLDAAALKDVLTLDAEATGSLGEHQWTITADPAVPGLAYSFQLVAFTPWKAVAAGGLSLTVATPPTFTAGQAGQLTLTAGVPANTTMTLTLPLPAGVQHDTPSLDALVSSGKVTRYETQDGLITLHLPPQAAGAVYSAALRVVPTLAGTLQSGPPTLAPETQPQLVKAFSPSTWTVR